MTLFENKPVQEKQLPLQLLLFGGPMPVQEGVVEEVSLLSDDEDEQLTAQLLQGDEELLIAKVVQPRKRRCRTGQVHPKKKQQMLLAVLVQCLLSLSLKLRVQQG